MRPRVAVCARLFGLSALIFGSLVFSSQLALAQFGQQGPKLVGGGSLGAANQGTSVALSADGNTAIVGGPNDNLDPNTGLGTGAAWVYTRSNGVWTSQAKLVGTGAVGGALQGHSVAMSADGNTVIVGGPCDSSTDPANCSGGGQAIGAAWVFTRNNGVWTQQGNKLVGTGAVGTATQGWSVGLSADGNTAIVGALNDNSSTGAAWVYTRSNGSQWRQVGKKLVGSASFGSSQQGQSVGLSADGSTAIVGGPLDNSGTGAAWVFGLSNGVWSQQGSKLVGTGAAGPDSQQGSSVALSTDGTTAIVGAHGDNRIPPSAVGATWVYTRTNGVWTQQGSKLVGTGADIGGAWQGASVALSGDGNTAIVGGSLDNISTGLITGATWVFTRSGNLWTQQGSKLVGTGAAGPNSQQGASVALSSDGTTAIVGGPSDNYGTGAAWVFRLNVYCFYSGAIQEPKSSNQTIVLAQGVFSIDQPTLSGADYHSLAELAMESADDKQIVEVGWTVDGATNLPQLFVFYWVNGQGNGYNTSDFHMFNDAHYKPGMALAPTPTSLGFAIAYIRNSTCDGWWIGVQNAVQSEYIGCYPASLWNGAFTKGGRVQWFGEVAASSQAPHTQMGDGLFATNPRSAFVNSMFFQDAAGRRWASPVRNNTNAAYYSLELSAYNFRYGGPGAR
jgi:hypothetical protein